MAPGFLRRLAAEWVNTPEAPRSMRQRMAEIAAAREGGRPLAPPAQPR